MRWSRFIATGLCAATLTMAQPSRAPQFGTSISGHLMDPAGRPLANWRVQAGRWEYYQGRKTFTLLAKTTVTTSNNGEFTISHLDSGEYYIRAENASEWMRNFAINVRIGVPAGQDYPATYFPGVNDILSATPIAVDTGRKISGMDFRVRDAARFHVRGRFAGASSALIALRPEPMIVRGDSRFIRPKPDGTFDVDRVLPGGYVISGYGLGATTYAVVGVKDSDVDNVMVQMLPCAKIRGSVRVDGHPSTARLSISALTEAISYGVQVDKAGALTSQCVTPGHYSLPIELAADAYIRSIRLDGRDVTYKSLDLTSPSDKRLDIELGSQAGIIRGRLDNGSPGITVTVWSSDGDFNSSVITDATGSFEFTHLPPGAYHVAAWDRLHSQASGWGIQTMGAFRDEFNSKASAIVVERGGKVALNPVLMSFQSIQEAARKLHLNVMMMPEDQESAIREAVKSPDTLASLIAANPHIDKNTLAKALSIDEGDFSLPCHFQVGECSVKVERIEPVSNPEMAFVVIHSDIPGLDVYLRYTRKPGSLWHFTGAAGSSAHYGAPTHEFVRMWGKPFLKTDSDWSQNGGGIVNHVEEWFDLTDAEFKPAFSFTSEGGSNGFSMAVSTSSTSAAKIGRSGAKEQIELTVKMHFIGTAFDAERLFVGIYQRPPNGKFKLVNAYSDPQHMHTMATTEFEALSKPTGDSEVNLLSYVLAELRKIASGSEPSAREWLKTVLEYSRDSSEKRELLALLKKRP